MGEVEGKRAFILPIRYSEEVYQIAVVFSRTIDGFPVTSPGAKIAVHLDVEGSVVAHRATFRNTSLCLKQFGGKSLIPPGEAEHIVLEKLANRGVHLDEYEIAREEFGYYFAGRRSIQNVVVPHYAFFLNPKGEKGLKRLVEILPATTDKEVLAILEEDEKLEQNRIGELLRYSNPESSR